MLRVARTASLVLVLLGTVSIPTAAQDSVEGAWLFLVTAPELAQMQFEVPMELEQDGSEVTGSADVTALSQLGAQEYAQIEGSRVSDGLYEEQVLSFLLHISAQGQWMTLEIEADVEGDAMVGDVFMVDMGNSPVASFTAKRIDN